MEILVRVPSALRQLVDGRSTCSFDLDEAATLGELLDAVARTHPAIERRIRDEQGALRPHVNLFVGDADVRSLGGTSTVLHPSDEVSVVAAISGG